MIKTKIYDSEEINIISQVQAIALTAALPIVLTIFKHFFTKCDQNSQRYEEIESLTIDKIVSAVKDDIYLKEHHYSVSDSFIKETVNQLVNKRFILDDNSKLSLTSLGRKAIKLLLSIETSNR